MSVSDQKKRVLYIDPEPMNGKGLRRISRGACSVFIARNTAEAHQIFQAGKSIIGTVIAEYRMPGEITGLDFLNYIQNFHPHVERVLTSTFVDPRIRQALEKGEIHSHLPKPWDEDELASLLMIQGA